MEEQIKEVRVEIKKDRKKYDRFLVRDKERLTYINQTMNTKRCVELSYVKEIQRVKARLQQEEEKNPDLHLPKQRSLENLRSQEGGSRQNSQGNLHQSKKSSSSLGKQGSFKTNMANAANSKGYKDYNIPTYKNVKPRLYNTIKSNRVEKEPKLKKAQTPTIEGLNGTVAQMIANAKKEFNQACDALQ